MTLEKLNGQSLSGGEARVPPMLHHEIISEELRMTGAASGPDIISAILIDWVEKEREKGVFDSLVLDEVAGVVADDVFAAISILAEAIGPGMVHRSMSTSINNLRRSVGVGLSQEKDKKLEMGIKSPTLTLGSESHRLAEILMTEDKFWHAFPGKFDLVVENNNVVGFVEKVEETKPFEQAVLGDIGLDGTAANSNISGFRELVFPNTAGPDEISNSGPRFIRLENPIPAPNEGQSKLHWALETVKTGLATIYQNRGALPEKPSDVTKILNDENLRGPFMQVMEVAHFLLGSENGLNQVGWDDKDDKKGEIRASQINGFKSLDLLALMRITLERYQGYEKVNNRQAALVEISEGNMTVQYKYPENGDEKKKMGTQEVKAGQIDFLTLHFESEEKEEQGFDLGLLAPLPDPNPDGGFVAMENYRKLFFSAVGGSGKEPNFDKLKTGNVHLAVTLLGYMESTVGSKIAGSDQAVTWKARDVMRWRKKLESRLSSGDFGKNAGLGIKEAVKIIEKKFKKSRNLEVLFKELYGIYGDRIFTDLVVEVNDLKFLAGDGGWFSVYQANNLPQPKDAKQVETYLFKIASQLYRVKEWVNQTLDTGSRKGISRSEGQIIKINKVSDFIRKYQLQRRITGKLLYQTPSGEIESELSLKKDHKGLGEQGTKAFKIDPERNDQLIKKIQVLRALRRIVGSRLDGVEKTTREIKKIPSELSEICIQNDGGVFLCIDNLERLIERRVVETGEAKITNLVHMGDQRVKIIWVDNLTEGCPPLRISVNEKGRFAIYGFKNQLITGKLLSSEDFEGVSENPVDLSIFFLDQIWDKFGHEWSGENTPPILDSHGTVLFPNLDGDKTKILWPDGSLRDQVYKKPIVTSWNGMTGRWFLDPKLLEIAAENGDNRHDTVRLYDLVKNKFRGKRMLLCPVSSHANLDKESRAAEWSWHGEYCHILCRVPGCAGSIDIKQALGVKKEWRPVKAGPENYEVANFRPLGEDRARIIETTTDIAAYFAQVDNSAKRYITEVRCLAEENVGPFGYVPQWFAKTLWNLSENSTFQEIFATDGNAAMVNFVERMHALKIKDANGRFVSGMDQLLRRLNSLGDVGKVLSVLPAKEIIDLYDAEIVDKRGLLSGAMFPLYWVESDSEQSGFVVSNVNVRGITLDGRRLFNGKGHWKIKHEFGDEGAVSALGTWQESTPAGVWVRDPDKLIESVARDKVVFLTEGIFNSATISRIGEISGNSQFIYSGIATVGTGYRTLYAFLRHLGIAADKNPPKGSLGLGIETIVLAPDFDGPGSSYSVNRKEDFKGLFPGINVIPVHEILPKPISDILPPFDPELFRVEKPLEGFKLDMNDLIQSHPNSWTMGVKVGKDTSSEAIELIEKVREGVKDIRQKYAYNPQK